MREFTGLFLIFAIVLMPSSFAHAELGDQLHKLLPNDGATEDRFGVRVDIDGDKAIVGAYYDDDNGNNSGSAYLFDVVTGVQLAKYTPDDGFQKDRFGTSVDVNGTTVLIGAPLDDDNGGDSGSVYKFDMITGAQVAKFAPSDGTAEARFGIRIDTDGTTAIIGALRDDDNGIHSGSAYLYNFDTGEQLRKLIADDGAAYDFFGAAVGISNETAIVGAFQDDDDGENSGSAYLFDVSTGSQLFKLTPNDGGEGDFFGESVSISGNRAIVGAFQDDDNGENSGSAYVFDVSTGTQVMKLTPSDAVAYQQFGSSVVIDGNIAIVGATDTDDVGSGTGSAYLFDVSTGVEIAKFTANDADSGDLFGGYVRYSNNKAIIGARTNDDSGLDSGSAYIFDVSYFSPSDLNQDGFVDGVDLGMLLASWGQNTTPGQGELNGIPPVDGLDLGILLAAWNPPPPATIAIPEPTTVSLFFITILITVANRRKA